jgi:cation-transporting P-type ATPase G
LRSDPEMAPTETRVLLVDEYRDLNKCDLEVIDLLALRAGASLFVAGDDDQSIYGSLRKAHPVGIRSFADEYDADELVLNECRRCGQNIVDFATHVIDQDRDRTPKELRSITDGMGTVRLVRPRDQDEEALLAARLARAHVDNGLPENKILILMKSDKYGATSGPIVNALDEVGLEAYNPREPLENADDIERLLHWLTLSESLSAGSGPDDLAMRALLDLVPDHATVLRGGQELSVSPAELRLGETMVLRPGERLATDGRVTTGHSALDTSAITGESIPVEAGPGTEVFAGSINGTGALEVTVTAAAADNSLARIVHTVEAEQNRKGAGRRLADRIAAPLVPAVLVAAALTAGLGALFGEPQVWIERALVVLVAASPCALALSVPVTVISAVGAASRFGALIKGGAALEPMGAVTTVALDKTGTLTRNSPKVVEVTAMEGHTRAEVLRIAAALEARREHPLAAAILAAAERPDPAPDVEAVTGAGLSGTVQGRRVRLGRPGWVAPGPLAPDVRRMQEAGATVVVVTQEDTPIGAIAVRDEPRPEAAEAVADLHRQGYALAMLTGDNAATAAAVAGEVGIAAEQVHAGLRPEDKARVVGELRARGPVAMIGDGVNDAPALAAADVGIAMGAMGSDAAIETADAALMGEDLRLLPRTLAHSRRSTRIMWQNIAVSLALIAVLPVLALFGVLGLAAVVLVHELAEVVIIANGIRAGRGTPGPVAPERGPGPREPSPQAL